MAATPEEFLGQQAFLARLEPPSPSLFLDLPPTPRGEEDGDSSFDDMALPYISRLLEEDMEDHFFYLYPNHPAVLRAQQPFAEILVDVGHSATSTSTSTSPSSSSDATASTTPTPSTATASPNDAPIRISRPPYAPVDGHASASPDNHSSAHPNGHENSSAHPNGHEMAANPIPDFFNHLLPGDQDMLNLAFLKGMEEARKFLPPNIRLPAINEGPVVVGSLKKKRDAHALEPDVGRPGKLKLMMQEEEGAREMFDEIMFQEHEICMKGAHNLSHGEPGKIKGRSRKGVNGGDMVDLHTLLLNCAQALSTDNRQSAIELLKQIRQHSSPKGDAAQRLAHYFTEGLEARLAGRGSELYQSLILSRISVADFLKANQLYMAACCCKKVAYIFADKTICNAVAGRRRLHIVDYGLNQGLQWPGLLRMLASREGGPPEVRITGIDLPQPGLHGAYHIEETGRRLSNFARVLGVPFKFRGIPAKRETVRPEDLNIDRDEVLVVISLCQFRHLMDESLGFDGPSPRDQVLNNIRKMRPDVFIHGIMNGSYGATSFLTRFREALFHYSAQFDLLDTTVPRDNKGRLLLERDIFGRSALNVLACEGADRVERPETYKQWQLRNHRAGLRQLPLNPEVVKLVLNKVKDNYHRNFVVDADQRWLLHRWKGRVLYAWSAWIAADAT